jgi:hypothetical protein
MRPLAGWRGHTLPKRGHAEGENEDAAAGPVRVPEGVRMAVTDGATEAAFSARWARTLAEASAHAPLAEAVRQAQEVFARETPPAAGLPWYAALKAEEGAFATALALTVCPDRTWRAEAVGDCALLHLRAGALLQAWPLSDPEAYGSRPTLVSSRPEVPLPEVSATEGTWTPGDLLLLATDAIAAYLLAHEPSEVCGLSPSAFRQWVGEAREGGMRNDDVTLLELDL